MKSVSIRVRRIGLTTFFCACDSVFATQSLGAPAFRSFEITHEAMIPTFRPGDRVAASTSGYGGRLPERHPQRGDIVVFALPRDPNQIYAERIVGLPGDTIQTKTGRLYINGALVRREPQAKLKTRDRYGDEKEVPAYQESLPGGATHSIVEIQGDQSFLDNTDALKVPPDNYFVMGDNRDNSTDSRVPSDQGGVGFVPSKNLIGRVDTIFASKTKGTDPLPRRVR